MPDQTTVTRDDHVGLFTLFVMVSVLVVFATPVPFMIALAVGAVSRLFGARFAAFAALGLGCASVLFVITSGETTAFLTGLGMLFWSDLSLPGWAEHLALDW